MSKTPKNKRTSAPPAPARGNRLKAAPSRGASASASARSQRRTEIAGVVVLGLTLFVSLAMVSLQAHALVMGPFGRASASMFYGLAGVCGYALIALVVVASVRTLIERSPAMPLWITVGTLIGMVSLATLAHLVAADYRVAGKGPGGATGEHLAEILRAVISTAGTALLACVGLVIAVVVATPLRMRDVLVSIGRAAKAAARGCKHGVLAFGRFWADVFRAILPERAQDDDDDGDYDDVEVEVDDVLEVGADEHGVEPVIFERTVPSAAPDLASRKKKSKRGADATEVDLASAAPAIEVVDATDVTEAPAPTRGRKRSRFPSGTSAPEAANDEAVSAKPQAMIVDDDTLANAAGGPMIVEPRFKHADKAEMAAKEQAADADRRTFIKLGDGEYQLPSIQLLNYDASNQNTIDKTAMLELSAKLTQTLENYGVKGDVVAIRPGPVVTMYEFAPAPGTRVNKIANLTDDLAMSLEALRVRIVAPIPGKNAVGIEVPNRAREKVFLKEIIADDTFRKSKAKLPMALGKDIEGGPAVVDLARMPHLLVAGTTGSGKSVAVNAFITSLLFNCTPEDVRLIMVDPKMLELSIYEGVPHLLLPVVTDPKKANLALRWAVDEMERRYDLLAQMGVRDISTYNEKICKQRAKWEAEELRRAADAAQRALGDSVQAAIDEAPAEGAEDDDEQVEITSERGPRQLTITQPPHRLPYIVVVIDEFADLMMCAPKEVETSVARIAQKARAAGIHLILATQRPSVDVITGLIKANFPSRIAFHVTAKVDSRTILDQGGAEALLGAGDMLFSDRGAAPTRLHGCYVDEDEIHAVVEFLKTQGRPVYNLDILKPREEDEGGSGDGGGSPGGKSDDEMYDKAVHIVTTTRNASISWVQRQLRIGYNRAARLVEEMEKQGIVSPPDHTNKREVMVSAA